jgi:sugar phosphate isomerase/epimerase
MGTQLGDELMLCNISVANLSLRDVVPAAAAAGFDCISILARSHRRAEREGLSTAALVALVRDHGLRIQELEAAGTWLGPVPVAEKAWLDPIYDTAEFLDLAAELGVATLVATHFGASAPLDEAAAAFAELCDGAAARGVRVALEFPAMAAIADVRTAWQVVQLADRPNSGILVDTWHHERSVATDADLWMVPPERILSVQISDATREPVAPLVEDVGLRVLPGDGELDVVGMVRALDAHGVRAPLGIEVLRREIVADGARPACARLMAALRATVAAARATS